jgi:energy-coupling factor transport system permease protein
MHFLKEISLGRYVHQDSCIHHLDPRIKIISIFLFAMLLFFSKGYVSPLFLLSLLFITVERSKIPFTIWLKRYKIFLWVFLVMLFIYGVSGYRDLPLSQNRIMRVEAGVITGGAMLLTWAILIGFSFLLTMTTTPQEITWGLESLLHPLKKIGLPMHELSLMAGLVLYFLPILMDETEKLIKTENVQGDTFIHKGIAERLHSCIELFALLIQRLYKRAETISLDLETQEYSPHQSKVTFSKPLRMSDIYALVLVVVFVIAIIQIIIHH